MTASHADTTQAAVMAVLNSRVEACRAKDIDRLMSLYAPDVVYFDIIPPHRFVGTDEVRRNFLRWFAQQRDIELETRHQSIVVSGDVAFAHMLHPNGGTPGNGQDVTVWVRATVCLQRTNDQWLITHEHVSVPMYPEG